MTNDSQMTPKADLPGEMFNVEGLDLEFWNENPWPSLLDVFEALLDRLDWDLEFSGGRRTYSANMDQKLRIQLLMNEMPNDMQIEAHKIYNRRVWEEGLSR